MEWVEVQAKTVEAAVAAALAELGLDSRDQAEVKVLQDPKRGFLGMGSQDAVVRVKRGTTRSRRRRRKQRPRRAESAPSGQNRRSKGSQPARQRSSKDSGGGKEKPQTKPRESEKVSDRAGTETQQEAATQQEAGAPPADPADQAKVVSDFVNGLVAAFGLEGKVTTTVGEDDIIHVDVVGEQTEALVGAKGAILQAILDLLKIVVQRKTHHRARIRLDIAGYAERRRQALKIYSQRLSQQVLGDGGEVMLEAMHPGDRKVVHDAVAEIEGVRSWSEGEEPRRSVIIGLAPGFEPEYPQSGDDADVEVPADSDGDGDVDGDAGVDEQYQAAVEVEGEVEVEVEVEAEGDEV